MLHFQKNNIIVYPLSCQYTSNLVSRRYLSCYKFNLIFSNHGVYTLLSGSFEKVLPNFRNKLAKNLTLTEETNLPSNPSNKRRRLYQTKYIW